MNASSDSDNDTDERAFWTSRRFLVAAVIVAALALSACLVLVNPGEAIVVTRFGDPVRVIVEPGLAFKLPPPIEDTVRVDLRLRTTSSGLHDVGTRDGLRIDLDGVEPAEIEQQSAALEGRRLVVVPPLRKPISRSLSAAWRTSAATSAVLRGAATAAGERAFASRLFQISRSYAASNRGAPRRRMAGRVTGLRRTPRRTTRTSRPSSAGRRSDRRRLRGCAAGRDW